MILTNTQRPPESNLAFATRMIRERDTWREKARFYRYAYLTVCAQFLVVCVAAVWGWTR